MIILDTCVIIFDALVPTRLTSIAQKAIIDAEKKHQLCCSDISLWEIAMLVEKKRIDPGIDVTTFLRLALDARGIEVLPISVEIATLASTKNYHHYDPADRLIVSTALHHQAALITCDKKLSKIPGLTVTW